MKKNEIRLGNIIKSVSFEGRETLPWIVYPSDMIEMYNKDNWNRYRGIELTREWFIKCGFVLDGEYFKKGELDMNYCFKYYPHLGGYYFYVEYTDSPNEKDISEHYPISCTYKYVHELQNLYYVLTKEELKIDL